MPELCTTPKLWANDHGKINGSLSHPTIASKGTGTTLDTWEATICVKFLPHSSGSDVRLQPKSASYTLNGNLVNIHIECELIEDPINKHNEGCTSSIKIQVKDVPRGMTAGLSFATVLTGIGAKTIRSDQSNDCITCI